MLVLAELVYVLVASTRAPPVVTAGPPPRGSIFAETPEPAPAFATGSAAHVTVGVGRRESSHGHRHAREAAVTRRSSDVTLVTVAPPGFSQAFAVLRPLTRAPEDLEPRRGREPESEHGEPIDEGRHQGEEPLALRVEEDAKRAAHREPQLHGRAPGNRVVEQEHGSRRLESEREDLRLARPQPGRVRERRRAGRSADRRPR